MLIKRVFDLYTIPSIALFGFLVILTGIGSVSTLIALVLYGILPMLRATYTGITTNNPEMTVAGSLLVALLAISTDWLIAKGEKGLRRSLLGET